MRHYYKVIQFSVITLVKTLNDRSQYSNRKSNSPTII